MILYYTKKISEDSDFSEENKGKEVEVIEQRYKAVKEILKPLSVDSEWQTLLGEFRAAACYDQFSHLVRIYSKSVVTRIKNYQYAKSFNTKGEEISIDHLIIFADKKYVSGSISDLGSTTMILNTANWTVCFPFISLSHLSGVARNIVKDSNKDILSGYQEIMVESVGSQIVADNYAASTMTPAPSEAASGIPERSPTTPETNSKANETNILETNLTAQELTQPPDFYDPSFLGAYSAVGQPTHSYSAGEQLAHSYSTVDQPTHSYSAGEQPAHSYSTVDQPTHYYSMADLPNCSYIPTTSPNYPYRTTLSEQPISKDNPFLSTLQAEPVDLPISRDHSPSATANPESDDITQSESASALNNTIQLPVPLGKGGKQSKYKNDTPHKRSKKPFEKGHIERYCKSCDAMTRPTVGENPDGNKTLTCPRCKKEISFQKRNYEKIIAPSGSYIKIICPHCDHPTATVVVENNQADVDLLECQLCKENFVLLINLRNKEKRKTLIKSGKFKQATHCLCPCCNKACEIISSGKTKDGLHPQYRYKHGENQGRLFNVLTLMKPFVNKKRDIPENIDCPMCSKNPAIPKDIIHYGADTRIKSKPIRYRCNNCKASFQKIPSKK